jgi:hypothetical protein
LKQELKTGRVHSHTKQPNVPTPAAFWFAAACWEVLGLILGWNIGYYDFSFS